MPSSAYNLKRIMVAIYLKYIETEKREFTIESLHSIVGSVVTVHSRSVANYLKQMTSMLLLEEAGVNKWAITDKFIEKAKIEYDNSLKDSEAIGVERKPSSIVDDSGIPKY